jgi:hypothetical protein
LSKVPRILNRSQLIISYTRLSSLMAVPLHTVKRCRKPSVTVKTPVFTLNPPVEDFNWKSLCSIPDYFPAERILFIYN